MSGLSLVTPQNPEPLTVAQAREYLRVDFDDEDAEIAGFVSAARSGAETHLKMSLLTTAWSYRIDGGLPFEIRLPKGPVLSTDNLSITYIDDAGTEQTLAAAVYQVSLGDTGVIRPAYAQTWPVTRAQMDAVTVNFEAGWAAVADIPPAILQAIRLTIGDHYAHRENIVVGVSTAALPIGVHNLLMPFVRFD